MRRTLAFRISTALLAALLIAAAAGGIVAGGIATGGTAARAEEAFWEFAIPEPPAELGLEEPSVDFGQAETPREKRAEVLYVVKCEEYVTLRAEPSTSAAALAHVPLGAAVEYAGVDEDDFRQVIYDGMLGYVRADYLAREPQSESSAGAHLGRDKGWARLSTADVEIVSSSDAPGRGAGLANDADPSTAWAEGADGIGRGEWLSLFFEERMVAGLAICSGDQSSEEAYSANARPRKVQISLSGRDGMAVTLRDEAGEQIVLFDRAETSDYLSIEISSAYEGTESADTCIADVRVLLSDEGW